MAVVEFNGKRITDKLDVFVKSELPWIASKTLQGLAKQIKEDLQKEMQSKFTNYSSFTRNSIGIRNSNVSAIKGTGTDYTEIFHKDWFSKGNQPAHYLKPQVTGGDIYLTRFQRRLRARGFLGGSQGNYMLPIKGGQVAYGRMKGGEYTRAGWGISAFEDLRLSGQFGKKNYRTAGSYVWVPRHLHDLATSGISKEITQKAGLIRSLNKKQLPPSGIYKVNKKSLTKVFQMLDDVPDVERRYMFKDVSEDSFMSNYERIFRAEASKFAN